MINSICFFIIINETNPNITIFIPFPSCFLNYDMENNFNTKK